LFLGALQGPAQFVGLPDVSATEHRTPLVRPAGAGKIRPQ
jgi:hypothetical protein